MKNIFFKKKKTKNGQNNPLTKATWNSSIYPFHSLENYLADVAFCNVELFQMTKVIRVRSV